LKSKRHEETSYKKRFFVLKDSSHYQKSSLRSITEKYEKEVEMSYSSRRWMYGDGLAKIIAVVIGVIIGCLVFMGIVWILWWAWGVFVPVVWPNGPYQITHMGYWQFFAGWVILVTFVKVLRGRK
jgi:uncharacterized membrane protein YdbT with pleckstrin-like domain